MGARRPRVSTVRRYQDRKASPFVVMYERVPMTLDGIQRMVVKEAGNRACGAARRGLLFLAAISIVAPAPLPKGCTKLTDP